MDLHAEKRFIALKTRLDTLHYCQPLSLAERLLNDLLKITDSFQILKKQNEEIRGGLVREQQCLVPLKKENERLVKDNNSLHMQLIKMKEEKEQNDGRWRGTTRLLEDETKDLKFIIGQKDHKLSNLENEITLLKEKLENAISRVYIPSQTSITTKSTKENASFVRKQGMVITSPLYSVISPDSFNTAEPFRSLASSPNTMVKFENGDSIKQSNEILDRVREELKASNIEKDKLFERIGILEGQVQNRELEIERLNGLFEGGQNIDALNIRYVSERNEKTLKKLNLQIDFLNKENKKLEDKVRMYDKDLEKEAFMAERDKMGGNLRKLREENDQLKKDFKGLEARIQALYTDKYNNDLKSKKMVPLDDFNKEREKCMNNEALAKSLQTELDKYKTHANSFSIFHCINSIDQYKAAYNSDKRAFSETLDSMKKDVETKNLHIETFKKDNERMQAELEKSRSELNSYKGKCFNLQRDIENTKTSSERLLAELSTKNEECIAARKKLNELEDKHLRLKKQYDDKVLEYEKIYAKNQGLEAQMNNARQDLYKKQCIIDDSDRLNLTIEGLLSEIDSLKKEKDIIEGLLNQSKKEVAEESRRADDYFKKLETAYEEHKKAHEEWAFLKG